jgi:hypothetical protein
MEGGAATTARIAATEPVALHGIKKKRQNIFRRDQKI